MEQGGESMSVCCGGWWWCAPHGLAEEAGAQPPTAVPAALGRPGCRTAAMAPAPRWRLPGSCRAAAGLLGRPKDAQVVVGCTHQQRASVGAEPQRQDALQRRGRGQPKGGGSAPGDNAARRSTARRGAAALHVAGHARQLRRTAASAEGRPKPASASHPRATPTHLLGHVRKLLHHRPVLLHAVHAGVCRGWGGLSGWWDWGAREAEPKGPPDTLAAFLRAMPPDTHVRAGQRAAARPAVRAAPPAALARLPPSPRELLLSAGRAGERPHLRRRRPGRGPSGRTPLRRWGRPRRAPGS